MAASSDNKKGTSKSGSGNRTRSPRITANTTERVRTEQEVAMIHEIELIVLFIVSVLLFLSNFGIIGSVGNFFSGILFGIFGFSAYIAPVAIFLFVAFWLANIGKSGAIRKLVAMILLFVVFGMVCELVKNSAICNENYNPVLIYNNSNIMKSGGGLLAGSLTFLFFNTMGMVGTILIACLIVAICIILLTEKSLISMLKDGGRKVKDRSAADYNRLKEMNRQHYLEYEEEYEEIPEKDDRERLSKSEEKRLREEEKENEMILRMEKKVSGVMMDTSIKAPQKDRRRDDVHEISFVAEQDTYEETQPQVYDTPAFYESKQSYSTETMITPTEVRPVREYVPEPEPVKPEPSPDHDRIRIHREGITEGETAPATDFRPKAIVPKAPTQDAEPEFVPKPEKKPAKKYVFPSLNLLKKGTAKAGDSSAELKDTALRLQQTLNTFGVKVTITDISQGPSVTRYELQPEQGVKVSKILGLSDDIKLNLAATDIRIEAPIPGKAAIGIEVPNKENQAVALRDLLESKEFKDFPSNIAFAVGKDIAGKTIVTDIAKMPHMLIAGTTGSGKSVCINTLIMSILYKAHPEDVKMIMVDPKVVELSVYNGIPHLLVPVITDPKKASAALHWAVTEMEERYKKFADFNVRDLKGYNQKVQEKLESGAETGMAKLPQIVVIVDELADLMMVCPGEVEESICRLAQLARACGIHLIIATQRPSVDVITGLIKANMPSRVAFAVSSGVDSRTILDQVGAEKLLGKGDMLFYPQGYSKPARIQGAFVSDGEVSDVVDFLKNQAIGNVYAPEVEEKIQSLGASSGTGAAQGGGGADNSLDEYFAEAGKFIIDKDKASIGMLQRVFKIGFNRAARIMDQLCEYGVVGEEEGTKPRKVLMSMEQFENLLEEM